MRKRKLTVQQQNFADEYIISGNASEAYKKSYKNVKKDSTARANSSRLLANANVSAYIAERMEELKTERVADQQEIMEFLTSVIRGEVEEPTPILSGEGKQKRSEEHTSELQSRGHLVCRLLLEKKKT